MKRIIVTALALVVILFSGTAFASLSEGTWTSSSGAIKTGTWTLTTYGNLFDTGVLDSRSYPSGQGFSWEYLGSSVYTISWTDFMKIPGSTDYYRGFIGFFSGGVYPFRFTFTDGNSYTITNTSGLFSVLLRYDSSYNFLESTNSYYLCQGIVDQDHNYQMTITSAPAVSGIIGPFMVGTIDNLTWDIKPVPIPASLWILGSGLLGLLGVRRRISR
jgi:hypothetical protein